MAVKRSKAPRKSDSQRGSKVSKDRIELTITRHPLRFRWAAAISEDEWAIYRSAIEAIRGAGIPFMLGGGFAGAAFTGRWRDTKDIDFYIMPADRDRTVEALAAAGFEDLFDRKPYDPKWIYRSVRGDVIVDIIWAMANQRAQVDQAWFERAGRLALRSQELQIVPLEEFVWCKLYIMQRDHCDWTDIFNVLYVNGAELNWEHLLGRLEEDSPLLRGMLNVYGWLCPGAAAELPAWLWDRLKMEAPSAMAPNRDRVRLLDSRDWFVGRQEEGTKLAV